MTANEIKVRRGEPVESAWRRLVAWVESLRIVPNERLMVRHTPQGVIIKIMDDQKFRHPFRVSAGVNHVIVSPGTVNDIVPVIAEKAGKRRIDNRDKAGKLENGKSAPMLKIDTKKAAKDGSLYVSLKVKPTETLGESPDDAEIVQTETAKGPSDGNGYQPLALLWLSVDRRTIEKVFQITNHNVKHNYKEVAPSSAALADNPNAESITRHVFSPR